MTEGGPSSQRGFILIAVLWIMAALATLASIYSVYVGNVAAATHLDDDRLRVRAGVLSAIELAAGGLSAIPPETRPSSGVFVFRLDRATVRASYIDEGARIDINAARKEVLTGLFVKLGAKAEDASDFADNIIAWRRAATSGQNLEVAAYQSAGLDYAPRQAPFQNVLELRLVRGLPPALVDRALPYLTIFSARSEVNIRVAAPMVLLALPKAAPDAVLNVLAQRANVASDGDALVRLLGPAAPGAVAKSGPSFRVNVEVRLDNGAFGSAEVVILVSSPDDNQPYHVLQWRDASDGPL